MNYLVIVAHPDDEVLGAGATINKLIQQGNRVAVVIMVRNADARNNLSDTLSIDMENAMSILGVDKVYQADFPNIKMNIIPHLDIVRFIETCIVDWQADAIITHHPSDTNIGHQETSRAVNAACRLFQRVTDVPQLKELLYMEIPSSTEWNLNVAEKQFIPNMFVEIGQEGITLKLQALSAYKGVMRAFPHPRSKTAIEGLAAYRGAQSGCYYAEAFQSAFRVI